MGRRSKEIYDELTGNELNPKKVKAARKGEMEFVKRYSFMKKEGSKNVCTKPGKGLYPQDGSTS